MLRTACATTNAWNLGDAVLNLVIGDLLMRAPTRPA
jgi:hypothetical protein